MKIGRLILGFVGSALITTSAIAADLPQAPTVVAPAPPPMAAPAFDWSGLYFGAYVSTIGLDGGAHVGFNVECGRTVFGLEAGAGIITAGPAFTASAKGRAGFVVGERVLLYGMAAIEAVFSGGTQLLWIAGGGGEFAVGNRITLFAEAGMIGGISPPGCCGYAVRAGINIHR